MWDFPHRAAHDISREKHPARMFHKSGCVSHVFAKQINLSGRLYGIGAQGQFVPIHFQEKCAVTA